MASFTPGVDRWLRHVGASIIAAGALFSAPFVLWALAYKTYTYAETGHWYAWGAPTQIGVCNRIISYALVVLSSSASPSSAPGTSWLLSADGAPQPPGATHRSSAPYAADGVAHSRTASLASPPTASG